MASLVEDLYPQSGRVTDKADWLEEKYPGQAKATAGVLGLAAKARTDGQDFSDYTGPKLNQMYTHLAQPPQSPAYDLNQAQGGDPVPMDLEQGVGKEDEGKEDDFVADDNIVYFPPFIPNAAVNSNAQNNQMGAQNIQADPIPEQGNVPIEINLSEDINPPPQTSAIMNAFSQAESNDKFAEAFARMRQGMAIHRRQEGSDDLRPSRGGILEHIARRMENATNFYNTSQEAALLFWGRNKPGEGQIIETRIEQGMGPAELVSVTPAGFTAYWVYKEGQAPGSSMDFWTHPTLGSELVGIHPPASINAIQSGSSDNYFIMLPMSWEGGGQSSGQQARQSRMNLLFFMNPTELQNLMEEGLFHRLEYYSDAFQPTFNQRYAEIKASMGDGDIPFRHKCMAMFKAVLETFTTTTAFTGDARVKLGRPDALYIYLSYKFYVKQIMGLTNELTVLNTRIENLPDESGRAGLMKTQRHLYIRLMNVIKEMDVWNFVMQTVPAGKTPTDVGYWNFSALGISRFPGTTQIATYTYGTKPYSCYPRWMYQTFQQLEIASNRPPFNPQQQDLAVNARVFQFTEEMPSALEMLRFKNFQSMSQYALMNREEIAGMAPEQKLEMLQHTWANKTQSVKDAMEEQAKADDILNDYIARAAAMTDDEFLQITSQNKATVRARNALQDLQEARAKLIPAFNNGQRLFLPQQQQLEALRASVNPPIGQNPFGTQVGVLVENPMIQIVAPPERESAPPIMYSYKRLNEAGGQIGDTLEIEEEFLLALKKNVAIANKNLIKRAILTQEEGQRVSSSNVSSHGLDAEAAARILGVRQFERSVINQGGVVDMDVKYYSAQLQEADNKELIDGNGNATAAARKADGVTLMMKTNLMVQRQAYLDAHRLLQEKIQKTAMTTKQGEAYWTDRAWAQEYVYQKYELYKKKWKALQTSWRSVARIDGIAVDPDAPKGQNRPPLPLWNESRAWFVGGSVLDSPMRVINTTFCVAAFDTVFSRFQGLKTFTSALRENVFGREQTLAQTWNNGMLLSFGYWARNDAELSTDAFKFQGKKLGPVHGQGTVYDQAWYDNYVTRLEGFKQQQKEQDDARRIAEQAEKRRQEQEALAKSASEFQAVGQQQRARRRVGDGDDEMNMGGGRRKKKTRSKKMRSRKKKTRKTRNKRGGETPTKVETTTETQPTEENPTKIQLPEMPPAQIREKIIEALKANDEKYKKKARELGEGLAMARLKVIEDMMMKKGNTGETATETTGTGDDPIGEQPVVAETSTTTTGTETEEKGEEEDWLETSPMDVNVVEEEEQYTGSNCAKEIAFLESDKSKKLPEAVLIKKQEEFKKDDNKCASFPEKILEIEGLLAKRLEEIKQSVDPETTETGTEESVEEEDLPVNPSEIETGTGTGTEEEQQQEQEEEEEPSPLDTQVGQDEEEKTPEEKAAEEALEVKGICEKAMKKTPWEKLPTEGAVNKKGKELKGKCPENMAGQIDGLIAKRLEEIKKAAEEAAALEQKKKDAKKAAEAAVLGQKCKADQKAYAQKISDLTESPPEAFPTELEKEGKAITERCQTVQGLSKKIEEQSNILRQAIQKALTKKAADEAAALAAQKKKEDEEAALVAEQKKKEDEATALAAQKKKEDEEAAAALALAEQKKKDDEAAAQPQYHDQKRINVTAVPNKKACDEVKIAPDTLYYTCNDGIYTDPTKSKKDESCKVQPPRSAGKDGKDYFWNKETGKVGYDMEKTCSPGKQGMKIKEVKTGKKKKECNKVRQNVYNIDCKTPEQRKSAKCTKSPCHKPDTNKPKPCKDFKARECEKQEGCELEPKNTARTRTGKSKKGKNRLVMNDRQCLKKSPTSGGYKNKSLKKKKRRKRKNKHKSLKKRR